MPNKSFCILPFIHLHVNEGDDIKPCCFGNNVKKFTPKFDFVTDPAFTKIRNDMLAGVPVDQCQNCYKIE